MLCGSGSSDRFLNRLEQIQTDTEKRVKRTGKLAACLIDSDSGSSNSSTSSSSSRELEQR